VIFLPFHFLRSPQARQLLIRAFRHATGLTVLCTMLCPAIGLAAEKVAVTIWVKDGLAMSNQPATIEAELLSQGLLSQQAMGGEPLELVVRGEVVARGMTGGDGRARLSYIPKGLGVVPIQVRVGDSRRVAPAEGGANLVVWERRNPIVAVELASLIELPSGQVSLPGAGFAMGLDPEPLPDAAEELGKLTQFYYRVVYVVAWPIGADGFQVGAQARAWLQTHKFPTGYVLVLPPGEQAWGDKLDELHAAGWTTIKVGIGRSKTFAETFLQRRLEAVMVPEPKKGEAPRKAKVAKTWKDIRKTLQ
jgi:hypothetical protein